MAAMFIILMIYMVVARPNQPAPPLELVETILSPAISGQNYVYTVPVAGGIGPRAFFLEGELPAGLGFDSSTGTIFGRPEKAVKARMAFPLEIRVRDKMHSASKLDTLRVFPSAIPFDEKEFPFRISRRTTRLPIARAGMEYEAVLGAEGGLAPYGWRVVSGRLPAGLSLSGGAVAGTPTEPGNFEFEVELTFQHGSYAVGGKKTHWQGGRHERAFSLNVLPDIRFEPMFPDGTTGDEYHGYLRMENQLPDDKVDLRASVPGMVTTGLALHGRPEEPGEYRIAYAVSSGSGRTREGSVKIRVHPARPSPRAGDLRVEAWQGERVSIPLPYQGLIEPVTVIVDSGLASPFILSGSTLTGTPAFQGLKSISYRMADIAGETVSGKVEISVRPRRIFSLDSPDTIRCIAGREVNHALGAIGNQGTVHWTPTSPPPPGLRLDSTGHLRGRLARSGTWRVSFTALDRYSLINLAGDLVVKSHYEDASLPGWAMEALPEAMVGVPYNCSFAVHGGVGNIRISPSGTLPEGLVFTRNGISGVPSRKGRAVLQVNAFDDAAQEAGSRTFILVVQPREKTRPAIVTSTIPATTPGARIEFAFSAEGGFGKYSWEISGALPPGLEAVEGRIRGVVSRPDRSDWPLRVSVADEEGFESPTKTFHLRVVDSNPPLAAYWGEVPPATVGENYRLPLMAAGCMGECHWSVSGLPADFRLERGVLLGVPAKSGQVRLSARVRDDAGRKASGFLDLLSRERPGGSGFPDSSGSPRKTAAEFDKPGSLPEP